MKYSKKIVLQHFVLAMFASTSLLACASTKPVEEPVSKAAPKIKTQQIQIEKRDGNSQVVLVADGETEVFQLSAADLKDEAKLAAVLAKLPEKEREQIKTMLLNEPQMQLAHGGDPQVFLTTEKTDGENGMTTERHIVVKKLSGDGSEPQMMNVDVSADGAQRHVVIKTIGETEFAGNAGYDMFKAWLTKAKLDKKQLQELQKLLDSKH